MVERPPSRTHRGLGWRRQLPDARDQKFRAPARVKLPTSVDLTGHMPPVLDQGNLGTCVTHGVTEALRYLMNQLSFPDTPLSRLQLYVDARILEGTRLTEDTGLEIRDAIKCAAKLGVAHELLWPYDDDTSDTGKFTKMPPANVYADALLNQALLYQGVAVNGPSLRLALASQVPVIFGLMLYDFIPGHAQHRHRAHAEYPQGTPNWRALHDLHWLRQSRRLVPGTQFVGLGLGQARRLFHPGVLHRLSQIRLRLLGGAHGRRLRRFRDGGQVARVDR